MPDGLEHVGAHGDDGLLAGRRAHRVRVDARPARHQRLHDRGDALLERLVERHFAPLEARDDLGGQVVGGRAQPAAGDDQVHALTREEPQRALDVLRAVGDDERVRVLHPQLEQALGQPRPVAVGHAAGEHLGARDDDAGARAHAPEHFGQDARGSVLTLVGVMS